MIFKTKTKKYNSYNEVKEVIGVDYNTPLLSKVSKEKTLLHIEKLYKKEVSLSFEELKIFSLFYFNREKSFNVLDVGGGSGVHYHLLKSQFKKINLKWTILETKEMVKSNKNNHTDELIFISEINLVSQDKFDLIFLSGVIQYIPNPYNFLEKVFKINSKSIVITRTSFINNGNEFYRVQKSLLSENGPGPLPKEIREQNIYYPEYLFSSEKFESFLKKSGLNFVVLEEGKGMVGDDIEKINKTYLISS